jgi:starch-binding outer membrane protein, SusD/RagB family
MKSVRYLILSVCCVLLSHCNDFIEEKPISVITSKSFWQTEADAIAGVVGAYDRLQSIYNREFGGFIHWTDGRSDVAQLGQTDARDVVSQIAINNITPTSVGADWGPLYQAISMANFAIANIPGIKMNTALQKQLVGEAYFIRAYCYFLAARVWGDVPLLIKPVIDAKGDLKPSRSPRATVLAQVREDIESALSRVPAKFGTPASDRGRGALGVVRALKVDFLLWMARVENSGTVDLQQAATTAKAILDDPMYKLIPNFSDIFSVRNNSETIWAVQYDFSKQETGNLGADLTPLAQGPYTGGKMYYQLSAKVINAYKNAPAPDLRIASTFIEFNSIGATTMCIKYIGSPAQGTQRNFDSNLIIYRVGGIKLMYAEALNELGMTTEAVAELNGIRTRAGLPNTSAVSQAGVRQAILDEHLVELPFEGSRWFTLIRSGRVSAEVPAITSNTFDENSRLLWPVAEVSLRQNENLSQNGAYK